MLFRSDGAAVTPRGTRYRAALSVVPAMRMSDYLERLVGFRQRGRSPVLIRAILDHVVEWLGRKTLEGDAYAYHPAQAQRVAVARERACWVTHEGVGNRAVNALAEDFAPWRVARGVY